MTAHAISYGANPLPELVNGYRAYRLDDSGRRDIDPMPESLQLQSLPKHPIPPKFRILLGSSTDAIREPLRSHGHDVVVADLSRPASVAVRVLLQSVDIVLMDVTSSSREVLTATRELAAAIGACDAAPRLLCFSTVHRNAQLVLGIERCGARFVRVADAPMLLETVDLLLAEAEQLRQSGPTFHILHRFTQGSCAPGEECAAVLLPRAQHSQLRLSLSERCVFNVLASHRRIALDSHQIAATLSADWFYRELGANSGVPQRVKVRVPAVRVLIGRIRDAMAEKFGEAGLPLDPFNVLCSVPAVGNNRVFYRLNADTQIIHSV